MANLIIVATQVGVLFALMAVGFACRKLKLLDDAAVKGLVNVLVLIVTPCLVVDCFQRPFAPAYCTPASPLSASRWPRTRG